MTDGYDIIGDIHGHADQLEALLSELGYRPSGGAHRHPHRQAVFVGDLIDRGPAQKPPLAGVVLCVKYRRHVGALFGYGCGAV